MKDEQGRPFIVVREYDFPSFAFGFFRRKDDSVKDTMLLDLSFSVIGEHLLIIYAARGKRSDSMGMTQ